MNEGQQQQLTVPVESGIQSLDQQRAADRPQFVSGDTLTPEAIAMRIQAEQLAMKGGSAGLGSILSKNK